MKIYNRRYTGSKYKLTNWIKEKMQQLCPNCNSFFDVFGGTGVVTYSVLDMYSKFILNDFLYSNEVIYKAFFEQSDYDENKIKYIASEYNVIKKSLLANNYVSDNYGNKYFSINDAKLIGFIREDIEQKFVNNLINSKEYFILLASLLYSFDRISNTVGHYEAYIKRKAISDTFEFVLIEPLKLKDKEIQIFREDSNKLVNKISCDIAFVDPPYNSRQYSRFYHVMETIVKWDKPNLQGTAMKPPKENMSDYCRNTASKVFKDLIDNLSVKYIVVTYNNTYNSKSTSSQNKITLEDIKYILAKRGKTEVFSTDHNAFNAGKTELDGHKEYLFITKVGNYE